MDDNNLIFKDEQRNEITIGSGIQIASSNPITIYVDYEWIISQLRLRLDSYVIGSWNSQAVINALRTLKEEQRRG